MYVRMYVCMYGEETLMSFPKRSKKFFPIKSFIVFSSPFSLVSCHHCFLLLWGGSGAVVDGSGNGNGSGIGSGSSGGEVVVSTASTVG